MTEQGQPVGRAARIAALVVEPDAHAPLLQGADHLVEPGEVRVLFQVEVLFRLPGVPVRIGDDAAEAGGGEVVDERLQVAPGTVLEHVDAVRVRRVGEPLLVRACALAGLCDGGQEAAGGEENRKEQSFHINPWFMMHQ